MAISSSSPRFWSIFWSLARPYWFSEERAAARLLFLAIVVLNLAIVWVNVMLNQWNGNFFNSLQDKNQERFYELIWQFTGWAFLYIVLVVYQLYLNQMLQMRWRRWLTEVWLARWMSQSVHYRLMLKDYGTDNPDQRLAEDIKLFVTDSLSLFFGLLSSVVSFVSFVGILWVLSGPVTVGGVTIPGYMVWIALVYALVGSVAAHYIGRPLIALNFAQEKREADFRYSLVRARENAEGIALYRGEPDERAHFTTRFRALVDNWWSIMKQQKRFTWFSAFYGQLAIIFPFVVGAPRYFSGQIQLGALSQISGAFGSVQQALSWFVDAYTRLASWRASIDRLGGFAMALKQVEEVDRPLLVQVAPRIELQDLIVGVPGRDLIHAQGVVIGPGHHTLVRGFSGSGKSTLFRVLARLWPFASGTASAPDSQQCLFLPQRPYLPLGSLAHALSYPRAHASFGDDAFARVLELVGLARLQPLLTIAEPPDGLATWSQRLSGGEQQRLAIARALLLKPQWLFLDEATSNLDEAAEQQMYQVLREHLSDTTLISIAHRPSVARFHHQQLRVVPGGQEGLANLVIEPLDEPMPG
jgi:vitamin B12/bleomycin/antimicrobial peptide transport system ATP-binding/permease protein